MFAQVQMFLIYIYTYGGSGLLLISLFERSQRDSVVEKNKKMDNYENILKVLHKYGWKIL